MKKRKMKITPCKNCTECSIGREGWDTMEEVELNQYGEYETTSACYEKEVSVHTGRLIANQVYLESVRAKEVK